MAIPLAAIGLGLSIASALSGASSAKKQKKAIRLANALTAQKNSIQNAVARRDLVRQVRAARAQALAAGSDGEVSSSAVQGAVSSVGAQGSQSLQYFGQVAKLDQSINAAMSKAGAIAASSAITQSYFQAAQNALTLIPQGGSNKTETLQEVQVTASPGSAYRTGS